MCKCGRYWIGNGCSKIGRDGWKRLRGGGKSRGRMRCGGVKI